MSLLGIGIAFIAVGLILWLAGLFSFGWLLAVVGAIIVVIAVVASVGGGTRRRGGGL